MIKKLFYFGMIALLATILTTKLQAQTPGENFDVTHYEINLWDFDFTAKTLQGETFIDVTVTAPTNTFVFELKKLTVTDVATDTYDATFTQEGNLITIVTDETIEAGETLTFDIRYGGNTYNESWGGVHWWGNDGYVYTLGVGFSSQPHNLGKTWFPCVDDFTDKATYSLYITVTNDKKAICGGNLVNTFDNGDGTTTWYWVTPQEIATYHISFAIGNYGLWEDVYHGVERDIPVQVYAKPAQMGNVPGTFTHVKEIAAFFEDNFGPYPFNRIGYVSTGKGCMESTDNIAMASDIINGNTTQEEYVAHELSHMYFGNKTTCSTAADMWLNEGLAQFCGMFYLVGIYGEERFQEAMRNTINDITTWCKDENNWIPLNSIPLNMTYDSQAVYNRGAVIANTMMNYMGRENFLIGLRHFLNTYAYGAASSEQFRDALTEATGIDMTGFFDTYVFTAGMPYYNVNLLEVTPNGAQYDARIEMVSRHYGPFHIGQNNRVEVTFVDGNGQTQAEVVGWDGMNAELTVSLDIEPIAAFVDYNNLILDAKQDQNLMATEPVDEFKQGRFKAIVNSVSDSTMLRVEEHFYAPSDEPDIPWLSLSTRRFWNFFRNDFGEADVDVRVSYYKGAGTDGDIIETENDSAVLLYRANTLDPWHFIPCTPSGSWITGSYTVNNAPSGQYVIGAINKELLGVYETNEPTWRVFPNPSRGFIMGPIGEYQITNLTGQTMMRGSSQGQIDVSSLPSGTYFIIVNGTTKKFIIQ